MHPKQIVNNWHNYACWFPIGSLLPFWQIEFGNRMSHRNGALAWWMGLADGSQILKLHKLHNCMVWKNVASYWLAVAYGMILRAQKTLDYACMVGWRPQSGGRGIPTRSVGTRGRSARFWAALILALLAPAADA
jgi:hypothetical protein